MDHALDGKTGLATYYDYDPAGRVIHQHHPNATTTYFSYDTAGRLGEKVTVRDVDASVLVRFAYTRDVAGNPIAIERETGLGTFYYEYDQLQRLAYEGQFISAVREYENYYEYDGAGNRTLLRHGETGTENLTYYEYDAANELTSLHDKDGWTYFGYDANGNTVKEQTPSYTRYYDWDGRDMLVGVRSTEQGWTDNEYRYDGLWSRVCTLESAGLTYYDWDGINLIQEKDGAGSVMERQVHGRGRTVAVGDIAHMDKSGTTYVPEFDQVGTVWDLLDSAASNANRYVYDAFGQVREVVESVVNALRFQTKACDFDTGHYYYVFRQYIPELGRYSTRDRVRFGAESDYIALLANPVRYDDPFGLLVCDDKCPGAGDVQDCKVLDVRITPTFANMNAIEIGKSLIEDLGLFGKLVSLGSIATAAIQGATELAVAIMDALMEEALPEADVGYLDKLEQLLANCAMRGHEYSVQVKIEWEKCEEETCCIFWKRLDWQKKSRWHLCKSFPAGLGGLGAVSRLEPPPPDVWVRSLARCMVRAGRQLCR